VLPAAASFKRQGANKGALASFLVSTPESGFDSIAITYALLDPIMTVVRPVAAFFTGIFAGGLENWFTYDDVEQNQKKNRGKEESGSDNCCTIECDPAEQAATPPPGIASKLIAGLKYGCNDVWGDIVFWFFAGLLVAGIITVLIPERISELVLGGGLLSMLTMLAIGMPLYICATASTPVAAALLLKGASPGAVLVFLLAGPATNMTSLSVLVRILGKRGTARYLAVIAVSSILFGLGVDMIYQVFSIEPRAVIAQAREALPFSVKLVSALLILSLSSYHVWLWWKKRNSNTKHSVYITGFPVVDSTKDKQDRERQPVAKKIKH
jgi:uncharacterized membrane protein YraQ (UPF0718 family)